MKREAFALVAGAPAAWLYVCTLTAAYEKIFHADVRIGFLSHARRFSDALASEKLLAPAKSLGEMRRVIFNDYVDTAMATLFVALVLAMAAFGLRAIRSALESPVATTKEAQDGLRELPAGT